MIPKPLRSNWPKAGAAVDAGSSAGDEVARTLAKAHQLRQKAARLEERASAFARGRVGEIAVARVLDQLTSAGYRHFDDRRFPGTSRANVDHVVVGPPGVFVVDAKNWNGRITIKDGCLRQNGYRRDRAIETLNSERVAIAAAIGLAPQAVVAVLCLTGEAEVPISAVGTTVALAVRDLAAWLLSRPAVLTPATVEEIALACHQRLVPASGATASKVEPPLTTEALSAFWSTQEAAHEPSARARSQGGLPSGRTSLPARATTTTSRRRRLFGRALLVFLAVDGYATAAFGHTNRLGDALLASGLLAWLVYLERSRLFHRSLTREEGGGRS